MLQRLQYNKGVAVLAHPVGAALEERLAQDCLVELEERRLRVAVVVVKVEPPREGGAPGRVGFNTQVTARSGGSKGLKTQHKGPKTTRRHKCVSCMKHEPTLLQVNESQLIESAWGMSSSYGSQRTLGS